MRQWTKLGLAVLATGCLFTNVATANAQTSQNNSSTQQSSNNGSGSQNAIYQISPSVSYQVPIYFLQNKQVNSGFTLNVNGYVGTKFGLNNNEISAPKGYSISKNADQYQFTLTDKGYKIYRYHGNQWGKYSGKIIISLNAKKVKNTTVVYQTDAGKKIKTQRLSGYVGYEIKQKYLKLPKGTKIPSNSTWITHYFTAESQQIIVTVETNGTSINNTKQKTQNKTSTKSNKKKTKKLQTQAKQTTKQKTSTNTNQNTQKQSTNNKSQNNTKQNKK